MHPHVSFEVKAASRKPDPIWLNFRSMEHWAEPATEDGLLAGEHEDVITQPGTRLLREVHGVMHRGQPWCSARVLSYDRPVVVLRNLKHRDRHVVAVVNVGRVPRARLEALQQVKVLSPELIAEVYEQACAAPPAPVAYCYACDDDAVARAWHVDGYAVDVCGKHHTLLLELGGAHHPQKRGSL